MCDPVSLTLAATAVAAAGQVYGGMAANSQGKYEQRVAEQNRGLELRARDDAMVRGEAEQMRHWRRVSQAYGSQRAAQAASGVDVTFGSSGDLLDDVMMIGYEDSQTISDNTLKEVRGYEINAANYTMQGRAARSKGKAALIGGVFNAGSTILGGANQVSQMRSARSGARVGGG